MNAHVPQMKAAEFLKAYADLTNARISLDDNFLLFENKTDQLLSSPVDWTPWMTVDYEADGQDGEDLTLKFADDSADSYVPSVTQLTAYGQGTNIFEIPRPLPDLNFDIRLHGRARMCVTNRAARSPLFSISGAEVKTFRPIWYTTGETNQFEGFEDQIYLHTTHFHTDNNGNTKNVFPLEIEYGEVPAIFKLFWRDWVNVEQGRACTFYFFLPLHRLTNVQNWATSKVLLRHDMGQVTVIVKELETQISGGRVGLVKLDCLILS